MDCHLTVLKAFLQNFETVDNIKKYVPYLLNLELSLKISKIEIRKKVKFQINNKSQKDI